MGMRDDIQTDMAAAFDGDLADAVDDFIATRTTVSDTLDPVTGTYPETVIAYGGRGVFAGYEVGEVDGQHILITDTKLIALQNEVALDASGDTATPAVNDVLSGYDVMSVKQDPAGATWELQLRGDGAGLKWILLAGAWSDSGAWRDSEVWTDG